MTDNYLKAKRLGDRTIRKAQREGRYPYLPSLSDFVEEQDALPQYPVGIKEIPCWMIVGCRTRARTNAFAADFMPILAPESEFASKWSSLYESAREEGIREAIKVYEYMWNFYVEEGNKRVSVSKYEKIPDILADITRLIPKRNGDKETEVYYEFMDFYNVCPLYEIRFSEPGSYERLAAFLKRDLKEPWPEEVRETLRFGYRAFERAYAQEGASEIQMTHADAFLTYLNIYSLEDLNNLDEKTLRSQIAKIRKELLIETGQDTVSYADAPESSEMEQRSGEPLHDKIGALLKKRHGRSDDTPLRIAFIYDRNPETSSWVYGHELGRNHLEEVFGKRIETISFPDCDTEEKIAAAIEAAVADEDHLIITTTPSMMPETLRASVKNPSVEFFNCSVNLPHSTVRCFYGRMYEAKFLMGVLAATLSDNHKIAYRASMPIYGTIADINAFAIGAAMADPEAKVYLTWMSQKEVDWRKEMYDAGIGIFSGPDLIRAGKESREYGLYRFDENGQIANLAIPVWDWGVYYEKLAASTLSGNRTVRSGESEQSINDWWGLSSGLINVILSPKLSYYTKKMIGIISNAIASGILSPFEGELHSQTGIVRTESDGPLSFEEIMKMDWLNDNIVGRIPEMDELNELSKKSVVVSGVLEGSSRK